MATLYQRPDNKNYSVCFYPRPGGKLIRASLGLADPIEAAKALRKVELLCELEKMRDVSLPLSAVGAFSFWQEAREFGPGTAGANQQVSTGRCRTVDAIKAYIARAEASNVRHALADKLSRLRQFFGSKLVASIDPRPADHRKRAGKSAEIPPFFTGQFLDELTPTSINNFFCGKNYSLSNKRHFRELFHGLFEVALKEGLYKPANPYVANPADNLPSFQGRETSVRVLTPQEVPAQYAAVSTDPLLLFGCQVMLEGGFRLHEVLALRRQDFDLSNGLIRLVLPGQKGARDGEKTKLVGTSLKTGERTVTMRFALRKAVESFLKLKPQDTPDWCFASRRGGRMSSHTFSARLRKINSPKGFDWSTQDFRHTFATNRIAEGWNLKTLAHEMGTSVQMLEKHYAGYIPPPLRAALNAAEVTEHHGKSES